MSRENPWTKHRQSFWQEKAGSPNLPLWLRVVALAYGVHRRNGHAPFKGGEIALATAAVDLQSGEIRQPDKTQVSRAIRTAIEYRFLSPESNGRCLVVPPYAITGGMLGRPAERCRWHSESTSRPKVDTQSQRRWHSESTANALTCEDAESLYDSSLPAPDRLTEPGQPSASERSA